MKLLNNKNEVIYISKFQNTEHEGNCMISLINLCTDYRGGSIVHDSEESISFARGVTVLKFTRGKKFLKCVVRYTDFDSGEEVKVKYKLIDGVWTAK